MDMRTILIHGSFWLWLLSFIPYTLAIYGRSLLFRPIEPAKPSKATWFIFAFMDIVVATGMMQKGTLNVQIATAIAGASFIFIVSIFRGLPGWNKVDIACIALTFLGVILWIWHWEANWGIVIGSIAMVVGGVPTLTSVWKDPRRENLLAWSMGLGSCFCILPTITSVSPEAISQPIAFLIVEFAIVVAIIARRHQLNQARP